MCLQFNSILSFLCMFLSLSRKLIFAFHHFFSCIIISDNYKLKYFLGFICVVQLSMFLYLSLAIIWKLGVVCSFRFIFMIPHFLNFIKNYRIPSISSFSTHVFIYKGLCSLYSFIISLMSFQMKNKIIHLISLLYFSDTVMHVSPIYKLV
jgi:hypothetical protein